MRLRSLLPESLTVALRSWRQRARSYYRRTLYSFTEDDLIRTLRTLGVHEGDAIIVHSSFAEFEGFKGGIAEAIHAFQQAVGARGALLMPTLPYSGSALDYINRKRTTDIRKTPSAVGFLTEVFRRLPDVARSVHPTHPVAGWGSKAMGLLQDHHLARTPCGRSSPFFSLLEAGGKIVLAGAGVRSMTYYHCIEELIENDLPRSPFTTETYDLETIGAEDEIYRTSTKLFEPAMSKMRDCEILVPYLKQNGAWREAKVGRLNVIVLEARAVLQTVKQMAQAGLHCYRNL